MSQDPAWLASRAGRPGLMCSLSRLKWYLNLLGVLTSRQRWTDTLGRCDDVVTHILRIVSVHSHPNC